MSGLALSAFVVSDTNTIALIWTLQEHIMNLVLSTKGMVMVGLSEYPNERPSDPSLRDPNGRFVPGRSGNPAGKKRGTRNRATVLREALRDGEDIAAARIVIDKALAGDAVAARFLLDRLTPRPRGRAVELDLPEGARAADVLAASNATVAAMAAGEITPNEALTVTRVLDGKLRALKAAAKEKKTREPARSQQPPCHSTGSGRGEQRPPSPLALGEAPLRLTRQREPSVPARAGEGRGEGAASAKTLHRDETPHPPIAHAMGPSLSRKGRGNDEAFRARLLHSACILQSPAALAGIPA
jgi:hypothetical protein